MIVVTVANLDVACVSGGSHDWWTVMVNRGWWGWFIFLEECCQLLWHHDICASWGFAVELEQLSAFWLRMGLVTRNVVMLFKVVGIVSVG